MGLSETIVAAMIGAAATVGTAAFQVITAIRARGKPDVKPKRGSTLRSWLAVVALMAASAAGGFLYSQLLREREQQDLRGVREELRELRELTAARITQQNLPQPSMEKTVASVSLASMNENSARTAESIAFVPACRSVANVAATCTESEAQRVAVCASVPADAQISSTRFFAQTDAMQHPWEQHAVDLEKDIGNARFSGKTFEYVQDGGTRAICASFEQWSSEHPYVVRMLVAYENSDLAEKPATDVPVSTPMLTPAAITPDVQAAPISAVSMPASTVQ